MGSSAAEKDFNTAMAKIAPELESPYATWPMDRERWLHPSEKGTYGEPCFIKVSADEGFKKNYVFGPGVLGRGYYSLLCKDSYRALHARLQNTRRVFSKSSSKKEYDMVQRIVYLRGWGKVPNDGACKEDAIQSGVCMHG